jgi:NAD(P)-dependent dehydrogenase (short-subunit alcohol dehydrogenase family)
MYAAGLRDDDPEYREGKDSGPKAYARTMRVQVVLAQMWADRLAPDDITVESMHPGWVDTHGVKEYLPKFRALTLPFLRSPEQGADTLVWLAATKPHSEGTERFWHDRRLRPTRLGTPNGIRVRTSGGDCGITSARPPESPWPLAPATRADRARPQRNLMPPAVAANRTAGTTTRYRGRPSCR